MSVEKENSDSSISVWWSDDGSIAYYRLFPDAEVISVTREEAFAVEMQICLQPSAIIDQLMRMFEEDEEQEATAFVNSILIKHSHA